MVCVAVLAVVSLAALWYFLSRWNEGESAWEHLPPETAWAVEIHDIKGMFDGAARDEGVWAFLASLGDGLRPAMRQAGMEGSAAELRSHADGYAFLSPLFTIFLPNTAIAGGVFGAPDEFFLVLQPPRWFSLVFRGEPGEIEIVSNPDGGAAYLTMLDGWAVLATDRPLLERVMEAWREKAAPFGARLTLRQPYLLLAGSDADPAESPPGRGGASASPVPPAPSEPGHFMLRDPLAGAPAGAESAGTGKGAREFGLRVAVAGEPDGWQCWLERVPAGRLAAAPSLIERVDAELGGDRPAVALADASDVEISVRVAEDLRANLLAAMEKRFAPEGDAAPASRRLGLHWVRDAWLAHADGGFSLLASRPTARTGGAYPPMPVVSLGWTLAPASSGDAAGDFAAALGEWIEALKAANDPPFLKAVGEGVRLAVAPDGKEGRVELPAVMVNAARPAWRFEGGMGWLGTDPSGLPDEATLRRLHLGTVARPGPGGLNVTAGWDMSREFLDGLVAVVEDRLDALPERYFAGVSKEGVTRNMMYAHAFLSAFPKAAVRGKADVAAGEERVKAYVPHGKAPVAESPR